MAEPTVLLTHDHIADADARARARLASGLYNRMRQGDAERLRRARDGVLGELALQELLRRSSIPHTSNIDALGPDAADFFLTPQEDRRPGAPGRVREAARPYLAGRGRRTVDVKIGVTRLEPNPEWCFGFPVDQRPSEKDVIVLGYLNEARTQVRFWGCIAGPELRNREPVRFNCFAKFPYETPNIEVKLHEFDRTFSLLGPVR